MILFAEEENETIEYSPNIELESYRIRGSFGVSEYIRYAKLLEEEIEKFKKIIRKYTGVVV